MFAYGGCASPTRGVDEDPGGACATAVPLSVDEAAQIEPSAQAITSSIDVCAQAAEGDSQATSSVSSHCGTALATDVDASNALVSAALDGEYAGSVTPERSCQKDQLAARILSHQEHLVVRSGALVAMSSESPLQATLREAMAAVYSAELDGSTSPSPENAAEDARDDAHEEQAAHVHTVETIRADGARAVAALRAEVHATHAETLAVLESVQEERARAVALLQDETRLASQRSSSFAERTLAHNDREVQLISAALGAEALADERLGALEAQVLAHKQREVELIGAARRAEAEGLRAGSASQRAIMGADSNVDVDARTAAQVETEALRAALAAANAESASLAAECAVLAEERNAARSAAKDDASERARLETAHAKLLEKHARLVEQLDATLSATGRAPLPEREVAHPAPKTPRAQMNREYDDMTAHYSASVWLESAPPRRSRAKRNGRRARSKDAVTERRAAAAEKPAGAREAVTPPSIPPPTLPPPSTRPSTRAPRGVDLNAFEDCLLRDVARSLAQPAALANVLKQGVRSIAPRAVARAATASAALATPSVESSRTPTPKTTGVEVEAAAQRNLLAVEFKLLLRAGRSRYAAVTARSAALLDMRSGLTCVSAAGRDDIAGPPCTHRLTRIACSQPRLPSPLPASASPLVRTTRHSCSAPASPLALREQRRIEVLPEPRAAIRGTVVADLSRSIADLRRAFTPQRAGVDYRHPSFVGAQADLRSPAQGLVDPLHRWGSSQTGRPLGTAESYAPTAASALLARVHSRHAPMLSSRVAIEAHSALSPGTWG